MTAPRCRRRRGPWTSCCRPGADVTCTFTNTKFGSITIVKDAIPDGPPDVLVHRFARRVHPRRRPGDDDPDSFTDTDLADGTYTVTETAVTGWDLQSIVCDDGTDVPAGTATVDIEIALGADVTCTFTNGQLGSITIIKNAIPNGPQDFEFTAQPSPPLETFILDDDPTDTTQTNRRTFSGLSAGDYTVTETARPRLGPDDVTCSTDIGRGDVPSATATITLPEGGRVTCTFTNTRRTATLTLQKTWIDGAAGDTAELAITGLDPATPPPPPPAPAAPKPPPTPPPPPSSPARRSPSARSSTTATTAPTTPPSNATNPASTTPTVTSPAP